MQSYKLTLAAGIAASLLIFSGGAANAQYSSNANCEQAGTCQTQNQRVLGNRQGRQQGQGLQGQRNGQGNQPRQGNRTNRGNGPAAQQNWEANLPAATPGEVPDAVVTAMQGGLADEQHAYAVYTSIIKQFGSVKPFSNIQRSEAQHIAAWEFLFDRYDIPVPAAASVSVPEFASLSDACQAAIDAEIANRDLYDEMLDTFTNYPDMIQSVTRLRTASDTKHLPAFERCAK